MNNPFKRKVETRQSSYTDTLVALLTAQATGSSVSGSFIGTSALETCAGLLGRAFSAAIVEGKSSYTSGLDPTILNLIGRRLITHGEIVFLIDVSEGSLRLVPSDSVTVTGSMLESDWLYDLTISAPSRSESKRRLSSSEVVHIRYAYSTSERHRGISPLTVAVLSTELHGKAVNAVNTELNSPIGGLIPIPIDGGSDSVVILKEQLAKLKGKIALVEGGDWNNSGQQQTDWKVRRLGSEIPAELITLLEVSERFIYTACGVNPAILGTATGTQAREAWRQFLFGVVAPMARIVEHELRRKLDDSIHLDFAELRASDLAGRSRALGTLVENGMSLEEARVICGF